jgi:hypothetical protein
LPLWDFRLFATACCQHYTFELAIALQTSESHDFIGNLRYAMDGNAAFRQEFVKFGTPERSSTVFEGPGTAFQPVPAYFNHYSRILWGQSNYSHIVLTLSSTFY